MTSMNIPSERAEFERWCKDNRIDTIALGSADTNGTWIGKRIPLPDLLDVLDDPGVPGIGLSDVCFVVTRDGYNVVEPENETETYFPNKETGYPDIFFRPDPATARLLSWRERTVALNGSFVLPAGGEVPISPRSVLASQVRRAEENGVSANFAAEFEFYILNGSPDVLYTDDYPLEPLWPRPNVYQLSRSSTDGQRLDRWTAHLENAGVHVEIIHPENGPGQYEFVTKYRPAMQAGDDAFVFKNGLKELASLDDKTATFIALPKAEWPGSSCHLHQSVWSVDGRQPRFFSENEKYRLSSIGRHYLGGLLATMREFTPLFRPTVNAYKRAREYSWAGTTVSWGVDNRSTGVRMVGEDARSCRFEQRVGGADVNPYLVIAACLAGGLYGIEHEIEPPEPCTGDAYVDDALTKLPSNLSDALDIFYASDVAREYFGDAFVNHYTLMKRAEVAELERTVTDWELRSYVETA